MQSTSNVKFIRKNGHIIPIKGSGSAPAGVSKRYGAKKQIPKAQTMSGLKKATALFAGAGLGYAIDGKFGALLGGALAYSAARTPIYGRGKGESKRQFAGRVAKTSSGV